MTAYQVISTQPNRSDRHKSVIPPADIKRDDPATSVGIDVTQMATAGNFPDYRVKLSLLTAYLLEATKRDFTPLTLDSRKVDAIEGAMADMRSYNCRCSAQANPTTRLSSRPLPMPPNCLQRL